MFTLSICVNWSIDVASDDKSLGRLRIIKFQVWDKKWVYLLHIFLEEFSERYESPAEVLMFPLICKKGTCGMPSRLGTVLQIFLTLYFLDFSPWEIYNIMGIGIKFWTESIPSCSGKYRASFKHLIWMEKCQLQVSKTAKSKLKWRAESGAIISRK